MPTDYLSSLQQQADRAGSGIDTPDYMESLRKQADEVGQMQFGATVANAITVNPESYARQRKIAQRMGVPTAAVEALPAEMEARDKSQRIDLATQNNPTLQCVAVPVLVLVRIGNVIADTGDALAGPDPVTVNPAVLRTTDVRAYPVNETSLVS